MKCDFSFLCYEFFLILKTVIILKVFFKHLKIII